MERKRAAPRGGNSHKRARTDPDVFSPTPTAFEPQRFDISDEAEVAAGLQFLKDEGYVVWSGVADQEELTRGDELLWEYLGKFGAERNDPKGWNWDDPYRKGILAGQAIGQSKFLWYCRALPGVKKVFSSIWGTEELATSFDGCCIHKPWEYDARWKPSERTWYHLDQNGHQKPEFSCVQGFLNFIDAGPEEGGLCIIARSHKIFPQIFEARPHLNGKGDWIPLESDKSLWQSIRHNKDLQPIKVCAKPGDFVCWDGRIIHCGYAATQPRPLPDDGSILPLRRLVAYVSMLPISRLSQPVIQQRIQAYYQGWTTSHWADECTASAARKKVTGGSYKAPTLTDEQLALIPMSH